MSIHKRQPRDDWLVFPCSIGCAKTKGDDGTCRATQIQQLCQRDARLLSCSCCCCLWLKAA